MNRPPKRLLAAVLVAPIAFVAVACSDDDGGTNGEASSEPRPEYVEYCEVAAEATEIGPDDPLRSAEMQLAAAPDELKPDLQTMVDALTLIEEGTASAEEQAEATVNAGPAFQRVVATLSDECGISVDLSG